MFVAHADAYNKARILHRDIRARNILISDSGAGILIDWDLSKKVQDNPDTRPGQYSRTVSVHLDACHTLRYRLNCAQGTWEFFSIARIKEPWLRPHAVSDDLESFFWVLMYEIVRYRDYRDCKPLFSEEHIQQVFGRPTGYFDKPYKEKLQCVFDYTFNSFIIKCLVETPCLEIIEEMRSLFGGLYGNPSMDTNTSYYL
jgi:serine/threonine protein kinase